MNRRSPRDAVATALASQIDCRDLHRFGFRRGRGGVRVDDSVAPFFSGEGTAAAASSTALTSSSATPSSTLPSLSAGMGASAGAPVSSGDAFSTAPLPASTESRTGAEVSSTTAPTTSSAAVSARFLALRGIIKPLIIQLDAPQELEPPARQRFIHNSNRELRARHRAIQTGPRLEHARAAIDDLVQSNANNDEPFQTVHVIHTVDDEPRL